jgi:hypothetical protein
MEKHGLFPTFTASTSILLWFPSQIVPNYSLLNPENRRAIIAMHSEKAKPAKAGGAKSRVYSC